MILECPSCSAKYNVPDSAIGTNGRVVRCKQCAHEWHAMLPPPAAIPELSSLPDLADIAPAKERPHQPAVAAPTPPASPLILGALAASFLLATIITLFTQKPGWFGVGHNKDVIITDLSLASQKTDKATEYAISGKLMNLSSKTIPSPQLRITLVDKEGNALKQWKPEVPAALEPNEPFAVTYGPLATSFKSGDRFVVDLGGALELAMRKKP